MFKKIINSLKDIKLVFIILSSLFLLIKSEPESELTNIVLDESNFTDTYNIESCLKFNVTFGEDYDYSYLKINVEANNEIGRILSYYQQDFNFNDRKQLSQSSTDPTMMWLNKEQIKNNFYFSIECAKYPCEVKLDLIASNNGVLDIDTQYTYFVTEENKKMVFAIDANKYIELFNTSDEYIVTIWAKGSQDIHSTLKGNEIEDLVSKHIYYRVNLSEFNNTLYYLTIEGNPDDLINIGLLLFKVEDSGYDNYLITESIFSYNGMEITGWIEPHEKVVFKMNEYAYNLEIPYNLDTNEELPSHASDDGTEGYFTVDLRANGDEGVFFSYKFLKENNEQEFSSHYPQSFGFYYSKKIEEGKTIGLMHLKPDNFTFLKYEIFNLYSDQEISVSIYHCTNYPLCNLDNNNDNITKVPNFGLFNYYTYNRKEWSKDMSSKTQNILLIKCEKGITINNKKLCFIKEDMSFDKTTINMNGYKQLNHPLYKYIRKDEENKYFFKGTNNKIYLNVETFSGQISITTNPKENQVFENGNQKLYIFEENKDLNISIQGSNNSIYLINDIYPLIYDKQIINSGANYFLNIDKDNELILEPLEFFEYKSDIKKEFYIGINPIKCKINVSKNKNGAINVLPEKDGFYQEIVSNLDFKYNISNTNGADSCLCYISFYELDNKNGIFLANNNSQSFKFDSNNPNLNFAYIHTQKEKDFNISLNLINEGKYKVDIYLNDDKYKEYDNIDSNYSLSFKSDDLNNKCKNFDPLCKIMLNIQSKNNEKESILEITVDKKESSADNDDGNKGNKESTEEKDNTTLVVVIILIVVVVLIIIIVAILVFRTYKKNKNLSENIDKTSFQEERKKEDGKPLLMESYA